MIRKYFGQIPANVKAPEAYEFEKLEFLEYEQMVAKADVIFCFDQQTKEAGLMFGDSLRGGIAAAGRKRHLVTIAFELRFTSQQLERLAAWTRMAKRSYDCPSLLEQNVAEN